VAEAAGCTAQRHRRLLRLFSWQLAGNTPRGRGAVDRWLALPDLEYDLEGRGRVESSADGCHTIRVEVFDGGGRRVSESEVVVAGSSDESRAAGTALLERRHIERAHASRGTVPAARGGTSARFKTRLGALWQRLSAPRSTVGRGTPPS
jgi:hypothetical protein